MELNMGSCNGSPPRVQGKEREHFREVTKKGGSPPRVRGRFGHKDYSTTINRLTPARAGKMLRKARNPA